MRLVFMGTPDFAVPTLRALVAEPGHQVTAVYTRAPAPGGRGMALRPSPVHRAAEEFGVSVETPASLRGEGAVARLRAHAPDAVIVVAYGLILPEPILATPALGCLNLHGSLLPRWRGAAPMQRAIMAGDRETGVEVMRMERGLDTGPVAMSERVAITPAMTAGDLHDKLAPLGAGLMVRAVAALGCGMLTFTPQSDIGVTYASKIEKSECRVDWAMPAETVHNQIRGLTPFPGAFFEAHLGRGAERVRVSGSQVVSGAGAPGAVLAAGPGTLVVACGTGAVSLARLQRAGKPAMPVAEFLRGTPIKAGMQLSIDADNAAS